MVDPSALAERLPGRPLKPAEASDIADQLDASLMCITEETANGTQFVPFMHLFVPESAADSGSNTKTYGQSITVFIDDDFDEWSGEVVEQSITQSKWIQSSDDFQKLTGFKRGKMTIEMEGEDGPIQRTLDKDGSRDDQVRRNLHGD